MDAAVWLLSPSTDVVAAIHPNMRISLYAAASDAAASHDASRVLSETTHAHAQPYVQARSAHAWGPLGSPGEGLLAVGTSGGSVVVWDTRRAEVACRIEGVKKGGAVTALAWGHDASTLYVSVSGSGAVAVHACSYARGGVHCAGAGSVPCDKRGCSSLAVSGDGSLLLLAHSSVQCVSTRSMSVVAKLAGHASAVTAVALSSDGCVLVTAAEEANVCVWDAAVREEGQEAMAEGASAAEVWTAYARLHGGVGGTVSEASHILLHPHTSCPGVSILRAPRKKDTYHLASHTADGEVLLWRYRRSGHGKASTPPQARLRPGRSADDTAASGESVSIDAVALVEAPARAGVDAAAAAVARGRVSLSVAAHTRGHASIVWSVPYLTMDGHVDKESALTLPAAVVKAGEGKTGAAKVKTSTAPASTAEKATVAGDAAPAGRAHAYEHVQPATRSHPHAGELKLAPAATTADAAVPATSEETAVEEASEPTLGERVDALVQALTRSRKPAKALIAAAAPHTSAAATSSSRASTVVATSSASAVPASMSVTLVQALQAGDNATVDEITSHSDARMISGTVERLPHGCVVPLITHLCARVQSHPAHAAILLPWLRACLCTHTGTLLALPHCVDVLSPLYTLLDARMHVYKKVFKLSGRLELLLSQTAARTHAGSSKRPRMAVSQADLEKGRPAVMNGSDAPAAQSKRANRRARKAGSAAATPAAAGDGAGDDDDDMDEGVYSRARVEEAAVTSGGDAVAEDDDDDDDDADGDEDADAVDEEEEE